VKQAKNDGSRRVLAAGLTVGAIVRAIFLGKKSFFGIPYSKNHGTLAIRVTGVDVLLKPA